MERKTLILRAMAALGFIFVIGAAPAADSAIGAQAKSSLDIIYGRLMLDEAMAERVAQRYLDGSPGVWDQYRTKWLEIKGPPALPATLKGFKDRRDDRESLAVCQSRRADFEANLGKWNNALSDIEEACSYYKSMDEIKAKLEASRIIFDDNDGSGRQCPDNCVGSNGSKCWDIISVLTNANEENAKALDKIDPKNDVLGCNGLDTRKKLIGLLNNKISDDIKKTLPENWKTDYTHCCTGTERTNETYEFCEVVYLNRNHKRTDRTTGRTFITSAYVGLQCVDKPLPGRPQCETFNRNEYDTGFTEDCSNDNALLDTSPIPLQSSDPVSPTNNEENTDNCEALIAKQAETSGEVPNEIWGACPNYTCPGPKTMGEKDKDNINKGKIGYNSFYIGCRLCRGTVVERVQNKLGPFQNEINLVCEVDKCQAAIKKQAAINNAKTDAIDAACAGTSRNCPAARDPNESIGVNDMKNKNHAKYIEWNTFDIECALCGKTVQNVPQPKSLKHPIQQQVKKQCVEGKAMPGISELLPLTDDEGNNYAIDDKGAVFYSAKVAQQKIADCQEAMAKGVASEDDVDKVVAEINNSGVCGGGVSCPGPEKIVSSVGRKYYIFCKLCGGEIETGVNPKTSADERTCKEKPQITPPPEMIE